MLRMIPAIFLLVVATAPLWAATPAELAEQQALLNSMEVQPAQLKPLRLETPLVVDGEARAIICHADDPGYREAAVTVQRAVAEATGVTLPLMTDQQLAPEDVLQRPVILLGHLNNNRHVAWLYHNFFVCVDVGFTGRTGYELRTVCDPFGTGHNAILAAGSFAEGTNRVAETLAKLAQAQGRKGSLVLGRLLDLQFDPQDRLASEIKPLGAAAAESDIARVRKCFTSPGEGRGGASGVVRLGLSFHRSGDPGYGAAYKAGMAALLEYYRTDKTINEDGMTRYDNDFRDAWTFQIAILWDLLEESGLFSDAERRDYTNLVIRLGLECVLYQRYNRPDVLEKWLSNTHIVHNHNTFPGLGVLFIGEYMRRHYQAPWAEDWVAVARGIFNGLKHTSKPMEDAAAYQWLPLIHCAIYSLSQGDPAFVEGGHLRRAAYDALQVMDNAGYQVAFGDHPAEMGSGGLGDIMQLAAWAYRDPELLWGVQRTSGGAAHPLEQDYAVPLEPREPASQVGVTVTALPRPNYDDCATGSQFRTEPNVPHEVTFNKLSLRAGWNREDEYLMLDGFGRGNHMHFDANAICRYARGGLPLLVDGEYIKNSPKYHSSMVIIRDGQAELTPAVTRLDRAEMLLTAGCTQTTLTQYNGTDWTRTMLWRPNAYLLVADEVRARQDGAYTLRCCWRPWGEATVVDGSLRAVAPPMRLEVRNVTGQPPRLELLRQSGALPISRFSEQIGLPMKAGEAHRFVNVIVADEAERWQEVQARQVRPGVIVCERGGRAEVMCLGDVKLPGLQFAGEALILSGETLHVFGARNLALGSVSLQASAPVSLEVTPATGAGSATTATETAITLQLGPDRRLTSTQQPGTQALKLPAAAMPADVVTLIEQLRAPPPLLPAGAAGTGPAAAATVAWQAQGFAPVPQPLPVVEVTAEPEPTATRGPITKLFDGIFSGSHGSVMWPAGQTAVVDVTLGEETDVQSVVLREWHMNDGWAVGSRTVELSNDGFAADRRVVAGEFAETGTQSWGGNVNTIYELPVRQRARQVRLTTAPANAEASVYLAEMEILGLRAGKSPRITALTRGDLDGDGRDETIAAGESGQCRAFDATGKLLWEYQGSERAAINCLAAADLDGDGKVEVMFGRNAEGVGVLDGAGKQLWVAKPPRFRGIASDVTTVFPGDVKGDGRPEVICGAESWQYFAYDAAGKMLWRHVIYAHAATVGCAADLDGDGKAETIAGNAYYQINVIDPIGGRLWRAGSIGPEMTAVASGDITGDGQPEVFTGVDGGTLYAYDATGKPLWQLNLGDKVTRLLTLDVDGDGTQELICAAESAHVFAVKGDGQVLWRLSLPDGCEDMALAQVKGQPVLVAACGAAGVALISRDGKLRSLHALPARAGQLVVAGEQAVVVTGEQGLAAVPLR